MSDLFVDNIKHQSSQGSGTITIGASGEKITTASGAKFSEITGQNYPAFEAYLSAEQAVTNATNTKLQCDTENFDTDNCYDNTTNYRFTPNVAGKYFVYGAIHLDGTSGNFQDGIIRLYKNGTEIPYAGARFNTNVNRGTEFSVPISAIIDMNGSTDYLEIFGYLNVNSGSSDFEDSYATKFGAYRIGA